MAFTKTEDKIFQPIDPKINPDLFGHKDNEKLFLSSLQSGNCHHAWLLTGNKGIGKFTFACRVARFIFATSPQVQNIPMEFWQPVKKVKKSKSANAAIEKKSDDFGMFSDGFDFMESENITDEIVDNNIDDTTEAASVGQKNMQIINEKRMNAETLQIDKSDKIFDQITLGTFADLKIITPDFANNKKEISIEDVLKIREFFQMTSSMGDWRVVIIDAVDNLNSNSANALLKILEEPPAMTLFLLVCHNPNNVLDTIKSRTRVLHFYPLHDEIIERLLFENILDIDKNSICDLIALCEKSIGNAYDLYNANVESITNDIKVLLKSLTENKAKNLSKFATDLARNNHKYNVFKYLINKFILLAIKAKTGNGMPENISENFSEIIHMISDNCKKNIQNLIDVKSYIENLFTKCDEINLEKESVIILTLKKILE
ncbi:MAG: hypothetical protein LBU68_01605 [Rickettsiales bacterium]|jgi:DNA polymerase-3 subunit delta'|nr:hypothetical protein [Rickettsiales bacterium]